MPALNNSSGVVVLLNDSMQVIDEMHYTEKMHHPLLIEEEGISLERISFEESALNPSNWTSGKDGHQLASPGFENAMSANSLVKNTRLQLKPEAFSPNEDGYNDLLQINYQLDKVGYLANLRILIQMVYRLTTLCVTNLSPFKVNGPGMANKPTAAAPLLACTLFCSNSIIQMAQLSNSKKSVR